MSSPVSRLTYIVTDISPPGAVFASAFSINEAGHAAGRWQPAPRTSRGFAYIRGVTIDIGPLSGRTLSRAQGINNRDQVVGFSFSLRDASDSHAFRWESGVLTDVHPMVTLGGAASFAYSINEAGHIAGDATTKQDAEDHAFLYPGRSVTDLRTLGGTYSWGSMVNNSDVVVGAASL